MQTRIVQVRTVGKMYEMYTLYPSVAFPVIQQTKMEEPQTPVSALLRLISVAYWW